MKRQPVWFLETIVEGDSRDVARAEREGGAGGAKRPSRYVLLMGSRRFSLNAIAVVVVVMAVDQVAKALVRRDIAPGESVDVIGGALHFVNARNSGIAGGRLADAGTGTVIAISAVALGAMLLFVRSIGPRRHLWLPVGLILGGGLGNLLDRARSGAVTDFIVWGHSGPANLADQAITLGIIGMLLVAWRSSSSEARNGEPAAPARSRAPDPTEPS
jgi:signal peptidase II